MNDADNELKQILKETTGLQQNVTVPTLSRVKDLIEEGAHYEFVSRDLKTLKEYLLALEIVGGIVEYQSNATTGQSIVDIKLRPNRVEYLKRRYNVSEEEILSKSG